MKYIKYGHGKLQKAPHKASVTSAPAGLSQFYKIFFDANDYFRALQEAANLLKSKK